MLVIAGTMEFDLDQRDVAVAAAIAVAEATRSEDGCHHYGFTLDLEVPNRFHVLEKWSSQEALDAHLATPHVAAFRRTLADVGSRSAQFTRYEIASERPLRLG